MTDKEIIIDGVDVSKCEFCNNDVLYPYCYRINSLCKENPNCYYKQLQRKTTECKRYEQALNEIEQEIHGLGSLIMILDIIDKAKDNNNEASET